jgi:uncharacterized repeat protein (TIGR03803 family)
MTTHDETSMKRSKFQLTFGFALACAAVTFSLATRAQAQTFDYFAIFSGVNGDGPNPPIQATDGNFYGTSEQGGYLYFGNLFRVTPAGKVTLIYSFCSKANCADGQYPKPAILGNDGNLYGVTGGGGTSQYDGSGTFYKMTLDGRITTLYTFCTTASCLDGVNPVGIILGGDGNFYGATNSGGQFYAGTLFKITPAGELTVLHSFCSLANCADGSAPAYPPIQGTDGNFYGTAQRGAKDGGTVYALTSSGHFNVVHTFCGGDPCPRGYDPEGLVQDASGNLFGTTYFGGANQQGVVFEITSAKQYIVLHDFTEGSESAPEGLTLANDGNLYGTTEGIDGCGTIFEMTSQGVLTTLYTFGCAGRGYAPYSRLFQAPNGNFYGGALYGYDFKGTLYSLSNGLSPLVQTVPTIGPIGHSVIILGNGLAGSTSVSFNGVEAAFTVQSDTYIKATVPPGATTGPVSVVTSSGTLSSNPQFVVTK